MSVLIPIVTSECSPSKNPRSFNSLALNFLSFAFSFLSLPHPTIVLQSEDFIAVSAPIYLFVSFLHFCFLDFLHSFCSYALLTVVQSLNRVGTFQSSIAEGKLGAAVIMGRSMVAVSSGGEKSPKCNVITNDKKSKKTEEPKESKNSPTPRRISARIQAKQKADAELLVCDKVEIKDNRDDAVDVKNVTPCKTNGNHENVGEERKGSKESPMPKRSSPRIQGKQKVDKELPVDSIVEIVDDLGGSGEEEKKSNHCKRIPKDENVVQEEAVKKRQTAKNLDESATEEAKESNESSMQRRRSSRVQAKQKLDKEHLVRRRVELLDDADEGKKSKRCKRSGNHESVGKEEVVGEQLRVKNPSTLLDDKLTIVRSEGATDCANGVGNLVDKSDFVKVKETLRLFNKHYLHFVQVCLDDHLVLIYFVVISLFSLWSQHIFSLFCNDVFLACIGGGEEGYH